MAGREVRREGGRVRKTFGVGLEGYSGDGGRRRGNGGGEEETREDKRRELHFWVGGKV